MWISLYWLGVVANADDKALAAYAERQTGKSALQFVRNWVPIIAGLKDWATREARVQWDHPWFKDRPRVCVLVAQWQILHELNEVQNPHPDALNKYAHRALKVGTHSTLRDFSNHQQDELIRRLGVWIRKKKGLPV